MTSAAHFLTVWIINLCFSHITINEMFLVVLQVYEQLYDTLDIVGGPEVRAQATAKVLLHTNNHLTWVSV